MEAASQNTPAGAQARAWGGVFSARVVTTAGRASLWPTRLTKYSAQEEGP